MQKQTDKRRKNKQTNKRQINKQKQEAEVKVDCGTNHLIVQQYTRYSLSNALQQLKKKRTIFQTLQDIPAAPEINSVGKILCLFSVAGIHVIPSRRMKQCGGWECGNLSRSAMLLEPWEVKRL